MATVLAGVCALFVLAVLVLMCVQLVRGCLFATIWWCCGGAGELLKVLAELAGEVFSGLTGNN